MSSLKRASLFLPLYAGLVACGFHLQGAMGMPVVMERTFIDAEDHYSPFYRTLERELEAAGIEVVGTQADATAVFTIYYDRTDQRVLSVSPRNVPTEYEVYYTIEYGVIAGEKVLLEVQDLTLTRDYSYDPNLVLGKAKEQELMRNAIVDDLARIVIRQISTQ